MADRIPVKAVIVSGAPTGLAEFVPGDTVPVNQGGTGVTTLADLKAALSIAGVTDTTLAAKYDKTGGAVTGNVNIAPPSTSALLTLTKASGTTSREAGIYGYVNSLARWGLVLGDGASEAGSNVGSVFAIYRYSDAGAYLGTAMTIRRNDGVTTFPLPLETGSTMYAVAGFSAPGVTGQGWLARTTSFYMEGNYRTVLGVTLESLGDTASLRAWHYPGVESFMRLSIGGSGNYLQVANNGVTTCQGGFVTTSDQRVKYDNRRITDALDKVDKLTGYTYIRQDMHEMDGTMPRRAGLIAQDVLKVLPEAVTVPDNYDPVLNRGDLLGLEQGALLGLFVEAMKELRAEVKTLRAEVGVLRLGANATGAVDATVKAVTSPLKLTNP